MLRTKDKAPEDVPNIIFLQLESFFDVNRLKDVTFSENPVPYFEELKETCPSGYFTAPSVGAGTANTEFEVITQMNVHDFGTGEYPYKTILQETPCESIAYDLKKLGLASHVIHNNTATFYDRNIVFPKLGFDSFTTLEYMNHVETNEIGWAKDKILTKEIVRALSETEERDLIYHHFGAAARRVPGGERDGGYQSAFRHRRPRFARTNGILRDADSRSG